jgi:hypothetical protein
MLRILNCPVDVTLVRNSPCVDSTNIVHINDAVSITKYVRRTYGINYRSVEIEAINQHSIQVYANNSILMIRLPIADKQNEQLVNSGQDLVA